MRECVINKQNRANPAAELAKTPHLQPGRPVDPEKDSAILAAARELLFEKGPLAVTMEAVAKKAGVSKVTVYARHKNRDELLLAVIHSQLEGFTQNIPETQSSLEELREALINFSTSVLSFQVSQEHLQFMRAISVASNAPDDVMQELYRLGPQHMQDRMASWLESWTAAGFIQCDNPMMSSELFAGMLQRLEIIRSLYRVSIVYSEQEIHEQAVFIVDAFLKMHRR